MHGNLDNMFELCKSWERSSSRKIDYVLQTGDLGVFPNKSHVDKATLRHAERDPTELGAADYLDGIKSASHKTIFVSGNHEDFDFLRLHQNATIDPAGRIYHLASGGTTLLRTNEETVCVAGFGGIYPRSKRTKKLAEGLGRNYQDEAAFHRLLNIGAGIVDILLCHDGPVCKEMEMSYGPDAGSPLVTQLIKDLTPQFVFFGHYGHPPEPFLMGKSMVVPTNNWSALRVARRDGAMGALDTRRWHFEFFKKTPLRPESNELKCQFRALSSER